ncbi:hypothetical protein ONS95_003401 [Cadophora gregata]|uniref:uncharacterized protein n=1 Tax=Cadophora gregata TaxID=51156 RepID=UPI0026DA909B|nr:uncharacterized protein ONS95_003401 [Cadophora gregata]KAK0108605.1 hypothetical protein ONS95_003401 [Cadophora gregata]KAK0108803.1 hypothetical protein ONS96_002645 [Cadophora gregata f. sp. sojae]
MDNEKAETLNEDAAARAEAEKVTEKEEDAEVEEDAQTEKNGAENEAEAENKATEKAEQEAHIEKLKENISRLSREVWILNRFRLFVGKRALW